MKWFKHDSDAHLSEKLLLVIDEEGLEWYARWFILLEAIASKMDETDRCWLELPVKVWGKLLRVQPKKLERFLKTYGNLLETFATQNGNLLKISAPNLLKKRDNYTKDLQVTSKKLPSKEVEVDREKEKENTPEIAKAISAPKRGRPHRDPDSLTGFEQIVKDWNQMAAELGYPKIITLTPARKEKLKSRTREPDFKFNEILQAFRNHKPEIKNANGGWKPDFDYVIRSQDTYTKILEGKFSTNEHSNGRLPAHLGAAGKTEDRF